MLKITIASLVFLVGCSYFTFNASMCEQIASDPHAIMPEECRNYVEEEVQKAYDNTKHEKVESKEDLLEFNKEDKEDK